MFTCENFLEAQKLLTIYCKNIARNFREDVKKINQMERGDISYGFFCHARLGRLKYG